MEKETKILDYRLTEVGRQNWEVCARMLVHDLLDIAAENEAVRRILNYYSIRYLENGSYTMALPRLMLKTPAPEKKKRGRPRKKS